MRANWLAVALAAAGLCAEAVVAAPALTLIQDTLYKADGSRFEGIVQVDWKTFQAGDGSEVTQQSVSTRVSNGALRLALIPTTNALKAVYYTVRFNSEGRTQFTEFWAVPPSPAPLRLRDVRTHAPVASPVTTTPTTVAVQDVIGLRTELDMRPARGTAWLTQRVAFISTAGTINAVAGNAEDCVRVDGTSAPCTMASGAATFVDGEQPAGAVDGINMSYQLRTSPEPANSVQFFRNGLLLQYGTEYVVSGNVLTVAAMAAPQRGDILQAWYRTGGSVSGIGGPEVPTGAANGVNGVFTLANVPQPAASLQLFRNGLLQKVGLDFAVEGRTITFMPGCLPQAGDILQANYRY